MVCEHLGGVLLVGLQLSQQDVSLALLHLVQITRP